MELIHVDRMISEYSICTYDLGGTNFTIICHLFITTIGENQFVNPLTSCKFVYRHK